MPIAVMANKVDAQVRRTGVGLGPPIFWQISQPYLKQGGKLCTPQYYSPPYTQTQTHCGFKWILRGYLKPPPSATV